MSTSWDDRHTERFVNPLTEARPPARPNRTDWVCVAAWVLPVVCFWGAVAWLCVAKGWL